MKRLFIVAALLCPFTMLGQNADSTVSLDVLRAPSSPAFNLLGISPSSIERPTDLNAFRLSIQNASSGFSRMPSDYSVEVAPANLARLGRQTLSDFNSTRFRDVFWQSFSVSVGMTHGNIEDKETGDTSSFTKLGFGLKCSLIRPRWSDKTDSLIHELQAAQREVTGNYIQVEANSRALQDVVKAIRENERDRNIDNQTRVENRKALQDRKHFVVDSLHTAVQVDFTRLTEAASRFKIERKGGFLDVAAGVAFDFPNDRFDYALTSKVGAWLTGGYEGGNARPSVLGIARYLFQPDKIFADDSGKLASDNISTLDLGARLLFTALEGKFTFSGEAVYRSVLNADTIDPSWRFTFNTEYDVGFNKKVTLAIGKNFNGPVTKDGNIIAALNFIAGFGSRKKIGG